MQRSVACLLFLLILWLSACSDGQERLDFQFETMGTVARCDLELVDGLSAARAQAMVVAVYDSVNAVFSTWQTDTELSRLNRAPADSATNVSPWLRDCLLVSARLQTLSSGAFDPTAEPMMRLWGFYRRQGNLPSQAELDSVRGLLGNWDLTTSGAVTKTMAETSFDLGGIAKGFAVDLAVGRLRHAGVTNGLVDLGGNLYCLGGAPGRPNWRVGVRDPLDRDRFFAAVAVTGQGVSTSGSYERFVIIGDRRYGHIMNPATGRPATGVLSATVFAPTALWADGLSTALFVLGPEAGQDMLAQLEQPMDALLVVPGREGAKARVLFTPGLENKVTILPEFIGSYELVPWF
jgi:thiamine biosynthesis lipoprotein